jgi:hypothetical protein
MTTRASSKAQSDSLGQADLFGAREQPPEGLHYQPEMIDRATEAELAERLAELPFEPFDFHGHLSNRQVVGFGLRYDYASRQVRPAPPIPGWLAPLRARVGAFAGRPTGLSCRC